uniref:Uncharacterized protein n=1 Tax=Glossina austeni TaxID=7395 RepID=A0A1A9UTI7_GLOAU
MGGGKKTWPKREMIKWKFVDDQQLPGNVNGKRKSLLLNTMMAPPPLPLCVCYVLCEYFLTTTITIKFKTDICNPFGVCFYAFSITFCATYGLVVDKAVTVMCNKTLLLTWLLGLQLFNRRAILIGSIGDSNQIDSYSHNSRGTFR